MAMELTYLILHCLCLDGCDRETYASVLFQPLLLWVSVIAAAKSAL